MLSPAEDLEVRWTDGGNAALIVTVLVAGKNIACGWKPGAGKGVVPAALIQKAHATGPRCVGPCVAIAALGLQTSHVHAGDVDVSITTSVLSFRSLKLE